MLRAMHRQMFLQVLEQSFFGLENYIVEFPTSVKDGLLKVTFIPESRFYFQIDAPDKNGEYFSWEIPATDYVRLKPFLCTSMSVAADRLGKWAERVREEVISANPFSRELAAFKQQVDRQLSQMQSQLEDFFTLEEAAELSSRLESFEARLNELLGKSDEMDAALEKLKASVADLQGAMNSVNKGTWLRMSAGRLLSGLKAIATSKEGREFALEAAKKVLLEGPK